MGRRLVTDKDFHCFYSRSHLTATSIYHFNQILKINSRRHNLIIKLCHRFKKITVLEEIITFFITMFFMNTSFSSFSTKKSHTDMVKIIIFPKYICLLQKIYTHRNSFLYHFCNNHLFYWDHKNNFCILVTYIMVKGIGRRYKKYDKKQNFPYLLRTLLFNTKSVLCNEYNTMQQSFGVTFSPVH